MKMIFYVAFAALVLVSAIYILKPQEEAPEIAETLKQEPPQATPPDSVAPHEVVKQEKPAPATPHTAQKKGPGTSAKQTDSLKAPEEGLSFGSSEVPDFPPLSPGEDDDLPSFGDLSTQDFGNDDFAKDDLGGGKGFFGEGQGWKELDSGELR
jgi:hypothetical protein